MLQSSTLANAVTDKGRQTIKETGRKQLADLLCFQGNGSKSRLKLLKPGLQLVPHLALRTDLAHLKCTRDIKLMSNKV